MKLSIYGFDGTIDELTELLTKGINISIITEINSGKGGFKVFCEPKKTKSAGRPARFTKEQVEEMYNIYMDTDSTFSEIAKKFGCSRTYVSKMVNKFAKEKGVDLEQVRNSYRLDYWMKELSKVSAKGNVLESSQAFEMVQRYSKLTQEKADNTDSQYEVGRLGFNQENGRYGLLSMDLWVDTGFHCGEPLEVEVDGAWVNTRMEMNNAGEWYLVKTPYKGDLEYVRARVKK